MQNIGFLTILFTFCISGLMGQYYAQCIIPDDFISTQLVGKKTSSIEDIKVGEGVYLNYDIIMKHNGGIKKEYCYSRTFIRDASDDEVKIYRKFKKRLTPYGAFIINEDQNQIIQNKSEASTYGIYKLKKYNVGHNKFYKVSNEAYKNANDIMSLDKLRIDDMLVITGNKIEDVRLLNSPRKIGGGEVTENEKLGGTTLRGIMLPERISPIDPKILSGQKLIVKSISSDGCGYVFINSRGDRFVYNRCANEKMKSEKHLFDRQDVHDLKQSRIKFKNDLDKIGMKFVTRKSVKTQNYFVLKGLVFDDKGVLMEVETYDMATDGKTDDVHRIVWFKGKVLYNWMCHKSMEAGID